MPNEISWRRIDEKWDLSDSAWAPHLWLGSADPAAIQPYAADLVEGGVPVVVAAQATAHGQSFVCDAASVVATTTEDSAGIVCAVADEMWSRLSYLRSTKSAVPLPRLGVVLVDLHALVQDWRSLTHAGDQRGVDPLNALHDLVSFARRSGIRIMATGNKDGLADRELLAGLRDNFVALDGPRDLSSSSAVSMTTAGAEDASARPPLVCFSSTFHAVATAHSESVAVVGGFSSH